MRVSQLIGFARHFKKAEEFLPDFLLAFGIIAVVLTVTALASGVVERSPLSFPLMFLGLGFLLGKYGFGIIEMGPHSSLLEIVATLTLALVLFLDAVKLQIEELGKRWLVPLLILGPGTVLIIALGAIPLALLLGFGWIMAFIGGARRTRSCFEKSCAINAFRAPCARY